MANQFPIVPIAGVRFSLSSNKNTKDNAAVEVKTSETVIGKQQAPNGLFDLRMGTCARGICATCYEKIDRCPGHFGYYQLALPVYNQLYMIKTKHILYILNVVCSRCSRLYIGNPDPTFIKRPAKLRLKMLSDKTGTLTNCKHKDCGAPLIRYAINPANRSAISIKEDRTYIPIDADKVYNIFTKIPDSVTIALGLDPKFSPPDALIIKNIPISPPIIRPTRRSTDSATRKMEDALTLHLSAIIDQSEKLGKLLAKHPSAKSGIEALSADDVNIIRQNHMLLTTYIAAMFSEKLVNANMVSQFSNKNKVSIDERIAKDKHARMRGNLMGKRVDFSARTVISSEPCIAIDQVGIPEGLVMRLEICDTVNDLNREHLLKLLLNGPNVYPGATKYQAPGDYQRQIKFMTTSDIVLQTGARINRMIQYGDIVVMNRQPTLHQYSIMAHRGKVFSKNTIGLNANITSPYNADYDGDEMNMHIPQSQKAVAELYYLQNVKMKLISAATNKPSFDIKQDTLLGIALLTMESTVLSQRELYRLLIHCSQLPKLPLTSDPVSGRDIVSYILPDRLNLKKANKFGEMVVIRNGHHESGFIDKAIIGSDHNGLIQKLYNYFGPDETIRVITELAAVARNHIQHRGFTIGLRDFYIAKELRDQVNEIIARGLDKANKLIEQIDNKEFNSSISRTIREQFEMQIIGILDETGNEAGSLVSNDIKLVENNMKTMISVGSKGSEANTAQMIACVGKNLVPDVRPKMSYGDRWLPCFQKYDFSPEAGGFAKNAFITGLTGIEFFAHACSSREGVTDTQIKTRVSGYMFRKLVKNMEGLVIEYNGGVYQNNGLVQFLYGLDGMSSSRAELQKFDIMSLNYEQFDERYRHVKDTDKTRSEYNKLREYYEWLHKIRVDNDTVHQPCNVNYIINDVIMGRDKMTGGAKDSKDSKEPRESREPLGPSAIIEMVDDLIAEIPLIYSAKPIEFFHKHIIIFLEIMIRSHLASKRVINEYKLSRGELRLVIDKIMYHLKLSLYNAGDAVGLISAQTMSEKTTQMTLNTFHFAGQGGRHGSILTVGRIDEIIELKKSKSGLTQRTTIRLLPEWANDVEKAKTVMSQIEPIYLKDLIVDAEIVFDPDYTKSKNPIDDKILKKYMANSVMEPFPRETYSACVIRVKIDRMKLLVKQLKMIQLRQIINEKFNDLFCVAADDSEDDDSLILRIYIMLSRIRDVKDEVAYAINRRYEILNVLSLQGISGILDVELIKEKNRYYDKEGNLKIEDQWSILAYGYNLPAICRIIGVDTSRTFSNVFSEMVAVFGIEAARLTLVNELYSIFVKLSDYLNVKHFILLGDYLTATGKLLSVRRSSLRVTKAPALTKMSYEELLKEAAIAAVHADYDDIANTVSPNIIFGQAIHVGTGIVEVAINEDLLGIKHENIEELLG
jgi:DNA-directed RNA polymerase II subunit RPB1